MSILTVSHSAIALFALAWCACASIVRADVVIDQRYGGEAQQTLDFCSPNMPPADGVARIVVLIHGGGWSAGDKRPHFHFCEQLSKKEYYAISVNYRLADGTAAHAWPAQLDDVADAISWVIAQIGAKRYKLCLVGHSAGGQIAVKLGAIDPGSLFPNAPVSFDCVVNWFGPVNLVDVPQNLVSPICRLVGSADPAECRLRALRLSEAPEGWRFPKLLAIHGRGDEDVPFVQSQWLVERVNTSGGQARLLPYDGKHSLQGASEETKKSVLAEEFAFLADSLAN